LLDASNGTSFGSPMSSCNPSGSGVARRSSPRSSPTSSASVANRCLRVLRSSPRPARTGATSSVLPAVWCRA